MSARLWFTTLLIGQSSLLFGYGMAALASVVKDLDESDSTGSILHDMDLSTTQEEMATGLLLAGAWAGSLLCNAPSEKFGRRRVLLANNVLFIAGAALCCVVDRTVLYLGRMLVGFAVGVESVVVPMLISEIAPAAQRGALTSVHQLAITSGILLAGVMSYFFVASVAGGWRYVQAFIALPAALQLFFAALVPESPRWMVRQNLDMQLIRATLKPLREAGDDLDAEIRGMQQEVAAETHADQASWGEVFAEHRGCVFLGVGLMFIQALTGINTVILYSTDLFADAGVSQAILATVSVGAVNVMMTTVSLKLVDVWGRKTLLLLSSSIMFLALAGLSSALLALDAHESTQGALCVVFVLVYVAGFAIGLGAVCWVVLSETVPSRVRPKTTSLFLAVNWALNLMISFGTLSLIDALGGVDSSLDDDAQSTQTKNGEGRMYAIYAAVCLASIVFIQLRVRETKGRTLEEIQAEAAAAEAAPKSSLQQQGGAVPLLSDA